MYKSKRNGRTTTIADGEDCWLAGAKLVPLHQNGERSVRKKNKYIIES